MALDGVGQRWGDLGLGHTHSLGDGRRGAVGSPVAPAVGAECPEAPGAFDLEAYLALPFGAVDQLARMDAR